jgi:hypothetical protein
MEHGLFHQVLTTNAGKDGSVRQALGVPDCNHQQSSEDETSIISGCLVIAEWNFQLFK